uniref:EF-hand calcium binding domain 14 n=1 Tax=Pelodiscus sinensis TaxID=13735 RepID=K7F512_PELSI|nr:EF-hand calcium-binding domain-containing protein 14 [Pelodiscus sinensis]|eukprot:XP_006111511.1 EF-hand calcium-binding domain-containing protein 14 [Pelodiscus sinensis]
MSHCRFMTDFYSLLRGEYLRCCKFCYPLCAFVILAACVVACVGLVWMQVALKEDLDALKEKIRTMESNQKSSFQEIPKLNEDLLDKQKHLEKIETGDMGLNKIWINITEINKQILFLTSVVNHLKANIKSASDLITLPVTVEELQKSVATIGSTLTSVAHDVEAMQTAMEEHKKITERLQNDMNEYTKGNVEKQLSSLSGTVSPRITNRNQTENCTQDNLFLHAMVEEINASLVVYQKLNDLKLLSVDTAISNISRRVTLLENHVAAMNTLESRENLSTSVVGNITTSPKVESQDQPENATGAEKALNIKTIEHVDSQVSKLREKLQLINALTNKPENEKLLEASKRAGKMQTATSKPPNLPKLASRSVGGNMERNGHPRRLSLPGIATIKDLQGLFEKTDQGIDGKLSLEDLQTLVGFAIQESQNLKEFDTDGDEKYSLPELRLALGV